MNKVYFGDCRDSLRKMKEEGIVSLFFIVCINCIDSMVRKTKKYGRKAKSVKKYKKGGSVRKNNYNKFSRKNNNQNNFYNLLIMKAKFQKKNLLF